MTPFYICIVHFDSNIYNFKMHLNAWDYNYHSCTYNMTFSLCFLGSIKILFQSLTLSSRLATKKLFEHNIFGSKFFSFSKSSSLKDAKR